MKQVLQNPRAKAPHLADVPPPTCGAGEVLIQTKASLISAGTEKMLIDFAGKSLLGKAQERPDLAKKVLDKLKRDGLLPTAKSVLSQLESPLPLGYSATGEVVAVGKNVGKLYKKGDRVAMAGAGYANHAQVNAVPKNLVAPLPKNVPYEHGAFCTLGAIALHGVHNAELTLGDNVLVLGLGLVGQLAAQLATLSGARVLGMDFDKARMKLAMETQACQATSHPDKAQKLVENFTRGRGFDAVLICAATDSNTPIEQAISWARDRANIVLVGKVGTKIPYADMMKKELSVKISRSYGAGRYDSNFEEGGQPYPVGYVPHTEADNLAEVVRLMADGKLNVAPLISHTFEIEEAEKAYTLVSSRTACMGVMLTYPQGKPHGVSRVDHTVSPEVEGSIGIAAIGAGSFAGSVLFPALNPLIKAGKCHLTGVMSKGGTSATTAAKRFGFGFATSHVDDILNNQATQAVLISTRHNSHAELVQAALKAGKHVFVEKPLALTLPELAAVERIWKKHPQQLMVGYNRRFSPMVQALQTKLAPADIAPRHIIIRVNAGQLPADNWQHDTAIGGGRLVGEVCHFLDLALALADNPLAETHISQGQGQDNYSITLTFENGGQAHILYTSEGDTAASKERIEVYAGGAVGVIDNFQTATFTRNGFKTNLGTWKNYPLINLLWGQDKGHAAELEAFVDAITAGNAPISAENLIASGKLPLICRTQLQEKQLLS